MKGAGGGQPDQPAAHEDKDTLVSRAYARIKDLVSEGPIYGFSDPANPLSCIYLDETPIENKDAAGLVHSDGITTLNSTTFGSASGFLNAVMIGRGIAGDNLPPLTRIVSVESAYSATLSNKATATGTGRLWGPSGSLNFHNFDVYFLTGTQDQSYIPGFSADETPTTVNTEVKHGADALDPVLAAVTRRVTDANVDAIRVDITIPQLQLQLTKEKDGKAAGSVLKTKVEIRIDLQSNNAGYVTVVNANNGGLFDGKASSPYTRSFVIELHGLTAPWDVRVVRITKDAVTQSVRDRTIWTDYTQVIYGKLRHPNSAVVGIHIDAQNFSNIPARAYKLKGLIIKVPTNYDPVARTYATSGAGTTSGAWDGTFKLAWSNNPAWCWYDLATSKRYGLGNYLAAADLDKWALYTIGQYCDGSVSNGKGGTEPRFSCNLYLQAREDAMKVLSDIAGIFRGMIYYSGGLITPVQDSPANPAALFSPANVVGGRFSYTGTGRKARHTVAHVTWNDMNDLGKEKVEVVEDVNSILLYGIQALQLVAFGCTSQAQAHRIGVWSLLAERYLTDSVTFATGLEGLIVRPGQVIQIQDPFRAGATLSGRVVSATTTVLTLDRPITLDNGSTYVLTIVDPTNDTVVTRAVTSASGQTNSVINVSAFPNAPPKDAIFMIAANNLFPESYRILNMTMTDDFMVEITALLYNAAIYNVTSEQFTLDELPTSQFPNELLVQPPGAITIVELADVNVNGIIENVLYVSWIPSPDRFVRNYRLSYKGPTGTWITLPESGANVIVPANQDGDYDVSVVAINQIGRVSTASVASYTVDDANKLPTALVTGLELEGQANNTTFSGIDAKFSWRLNSIIRFEDVGSEDARGMLGDVFDPATEAYEASVWVGNLRIWREIIKSPHYVFTFEKNKQAYRVQNPGEEGAYPVFRFEVRVIDHLTNYSPAEKLEVTHPRPTEEPQNVVSVGGPNSGHITWDKPLDPTIKKVNFYLGFDPDYYDQLFQPYGVDVAGSAEATDGMKILGSLEFNELYSCYLRFVDVFGLVSTACPSAPFRSAPPPEIMVISTPVVATPPGGYVAIAPNTWTLSLEARDYIQNAQIRYRYDASPPTESDLLFTGTLSFSGAGTGTVSARLFVNGVGGPTTTWTFTSPAATGTPGVVTPTFNPGPGTYVTYNGTKDITVGSATAANLIFYTKNDTNPTHSGATPTGVTVACPNNTILYFPSGTSTIRMIGYKAGWTDSVVVRGQFNISKSTVVPAYTGGSAGGGGGGGGGGRIL